MDQEKYKYDALLKQNQALSAQLSAKNAEIENEKKQRLQGRRGSGEEMLLASFLLILFIYFFIFYFSDVRKWTTN